MNWTYNELKHCGVDYAAEESAMEYDKKHRRFRDYKKECERFIASLPVSDTENLLLIDLGCGTGALPLHASEFFKKIVGIDISEAMLRIATAKADEMHLGNIEFIQGGFLSYRHQGEPADIVSSSVAFHHLPDFWKQIALLNINRMLKNDGIFFLFDIVFHFNPEEYESCITTWIEHSRQNAGDEFTSEIETHIRDEFSTFNWILEGMLARAGFSIETSECRDGFSSHYVCRKVSSVQVV
jgi:ubiquinone/menaquinone biosynthesis C-methylase UbiE